jgi:hypothetical protein
MVKYTKRRKIRGGNVKCGNMYKEIAEFKDGYVCRDSYPFPVYTSREGKDFVKCPDGQEVVPKCINNEEKITFPDAVTGKCGDGYRPVHDCGIVPGFQRSTAKITHNTPIDVYSNQYEQLTGKQSPYNSAPNSPLNSAINSPRSSFESLPQGGKRRRTRKNKRRGRKSRKHYRRK